ncbi:unnamed protein product [Medioppia subpectinata]|uniref:Methyltransferase domain-containing protein n=1 Tax=Medioppia subpectinata TaxID=1979941 RepID=A0A7R9PZE4_9ACAR|nr:unnamed protein product [Medioppia subpectinata]CAG2106394.1 unnamed protein product [Medioppia subpectinata]
MSAREGLDYNIIVDLGSGNGGITKLLATRVQHKRVIAIDANPAMTAYGQSVNSLSTIEYITQDMSVSWPQLSDDIRRLESKVDLIFSNFCFHYFNDKSQLLSQCKRLLATGGCIHAVCVLHHDLNQKLPTNARKEWCLSIDQQMDVWRRALDENGFAIDVFECVDKTYPMNRQQIIAFLPVTIATLKSKFVTNEQFVSETRGLEDIMFDVLCNPVADRPNPNAWTQFLANKDVNEVVICSQVLRLVCHKN